MPIGLTMGGNEWILLGGWNEMPLPFQVCMDRILY